jgi:hypothetical protein
MQIPQFPRQRRRPGDVLCFRIVVCCVAYGLCVGGLDGVVVQGDRGERLWDSEGAIGGAMGGGVAPIAGGRPDPRPEWSSR